MDIQQTISILVLGFCLSGFVNFFIYYPILLGWGTRDPQSKNSMAYSTYLGVWIPFIKLFHSLKVSADGNVKIEIRRMAIQIIITTVCLITVSKYGWTLTAVVMIVYCLIFVFIAALDFEYNLITNRLLISGIVLVIGLFPFSDLGRECPVSAAYLRSIIGCIVGFAMMVPPYILSRGHFGAGDVKLSALVGGALGISYVAIGLCVGIIFGGLVAIMILGVKRKLSDQVFAYGPSIAVGLMMTAFGYSQFTFEFFLAL